MPDLRGNPTQAEMVGLAGGLAKFGTQGADQELKNLQKRLYQEELDLVQALKPHTLAGKTAEMKTLQIQADSARYEQQHRQATDAYGKWQNMLASGAGAEAEKLALDFYNTQVFDGQTVSRDEANKGYILTDAKGKATPWNPTVEEIDTAWQGYLAKDKVSFFTARKNEERDRFNANYHAMLNRQVYVNADGDMAWWTDGVGIKDGRLKGQGVDGNGRSYSSPAELTEKGYQLLGTSAEISKDPERLKQYFTVKDAMEQRTIERQLFAMKGKIIAEQDPARKAAMVEQYKEGLGKLAFYEQQSGESTALTPKELTAVETYIKKSWDDMDGVTMANYESFDQYADDVRPALATRIKAEKKKALMSGVLELPEEDPGDGTPPPGDNPMDYLVPAKKKEDDKKKKEPALADLDLAYYAP